MTGTLTEEAYGEDVAPMFRGKKVVIIHLDKPISVRAIPKDEINVEEKDVKAIHLFLEERDQTSIFRSQYGVQPFSGTGMLYHATPAHQIFMVVSELKPARARGQVWIRAEVQDSPDKKQKVIYDFLNDDPTGDEPTHKAALYLKGKSYDPAWTFTVKGRALEFYWSPDSRHLLIEFTKADRGILLFHLDTQAKVLKERDLGMEVVGDRVYSRLPERKSGSFAPHEYIDFEKSRWLSNSKCQLHYWTIFDRKYGEAELELNLKGTEPSLKIVKIIPKPE